MIKSKRTLSKILKLCLLTSVAFSGTSLALAGDPPPTTYNYPAPLPPTAPPPPLPPQMPLPPTEHIYNNNAANSNAANFRASIDVSGTYKIYEDNNGVTTTTSTQQFLELRPYFAYDVENNGLEISASLSSTLVGEMAPAQQFSLGRSGLDFQIKKQGDFALGAAASYQTKSFNSISANPVTSGTYSDFEASAFVEKIMDNFGVSLSGTYITNIYNDTPQTVGPDVSETINDFQQIGTQLRLNYSVSPEISLFAEGKYERKVFVITAVPSDNETVFGIRTGGVYNFGNQAALEVAGQYAYRVFDGGLAANKQNAYGADVKLVAHVGPGISTSIGASTEFLQNSTALANTRRVKVEAGADFQVTKQVSVSADLAYDTTLSGPNTGQVFSANTNINYALNDNVDLYSALLYKYETTTSPGWKKDYGITVGLKLSY